MTEEKINGIYDAECLALDVGQIIYRQSKAKIFNLLESAIENEYRLMAYKRMTEDILDGITKDACNFIKDMLHDWEMPIEGGGVVSDAELVDAKKEYDEIANIIS